MTQTRLKAQPFSAKSPNAATLVDQSDHAHAVTKAAASRELAGWMAGAVLDRDGGEMKGLPRERVRFDSP